MEVSLYEAVLILNMRQSLCLNLNESGILNIGAGVRRIEAVTGQGAYQFMKEQLDLLHDAATPATAIFSFTAIY